MRNRCEPALRFAGDWAKWDRGTTPAENRLMGTIDSKLQSLGIALPTPASPIANYVGTVRTGNLLVISGQLCLGPDGKLTSVGQLGGQVSIDDGRKAARAC